MAVKRIIITGGPGSGKTAVIEELQRRGLSTAPEAGRAIIKMQKHIHGLALPWRDPALFAEAMLTWDLRNYTMVEEDNRVVIFDRGVPDIIGYLRLSYGIIPDHIMKAAHLYRYHSHIFIAPFWPKIYRQDAERQQTAQQAQDTCSMMEDVYGQLGYRLIYLPRDTVAARADFILNYISLTA